MKHRIKSHRVVFQRTGGRWTRATRSHDSRTSWSYTRTCYFIVNKLPLASPRSGCHLRAGVGDNRRSSASRKEEWRPKVFAVVCVCLRSTEGDGRQVEKWTFEENQRRADRRIEDASLSSVELIFLRVMFIEILPLTANEACFTSSGDRLTT